jgi:hypothetical protein
VDSSGRTMETPDEKRSARGTIATATSRHVTGP